jgi:response regulator RpfG family c-di-GMP phosphodiesterase
VSLKVLIADEDKSWTEKLSKYLRANSYTVDLVHNGRNAQLNLYNNQYFAVVLNLSIKNHSGLQVLTYISKNLEGQKVFALLESQAMLQTSQYSEDSLKKKGVTDIIVKPVLNEELTSLLESHQSLNDVLSGLQKRKGVSEEEEVRDSDNRFTKVKIENFFPSKAVIFDVFVKINNNRYVKILHSGDTFSQERIDKYKIEKNIEYLYFHHKDRRKYIQYTNFLAKKLINNKSVGSASKINLLSTVSGKYVEELFHQGVKTQVVDQAKEIATNVYKVVEEQKDLYQTLRDFQEIDPDQFTHAFITTLYASAIIKQFHWQSKLTIETMALACMFHDIGKTKLPVRLMNARPEELSEEDFELYKQHPELGVKIVEKNRLINNSIKQIIVQHHESYNGKGFPNNLKGAQVSTLANILCLVDDFVHMMIKSKESPTNVLRTILASQELCSRYNSIILESFIKVFVDPGNLQVSKGKGSSKSGNKKAS